MQEQERAVLRQKLNGTRVPTTQGQSTAPTEIDMGDLRSQRRSIRDIQWVVDAMIGKVLSHDDVVGLVDDVRNLKTSFKMIMIGGMVGMVANFIMFVVTAILIALAVFYR